MADPVSMVVADIARRLEAADFRPFTLFLSDGSRVEVPTRDHCTITRLLRRIEVEYDDLTMIRVNPLHITRIEERSSAA